MKSMFALAVVATLLAGTTNAQEGPHGYIHSDKEMGRGTIAHGIGRRDQPGAKQQNNKASTAGSPAPKARWRTKGR